MFENERIKPRGIDPRRDEDPAHDEAHEPVGVQVAKKYLHTRPDLGPDFYADLLSLFPSDRDAIIALLHKERGNGFVARMLAGTESSPKVDVGLSFEQIDLDNGQKTPSTDRWESGGS